MTDYAYIVPSNTKYLPGVTALLNSLERFGNKYDVIFQHYLIDPGYLAKLKDYSFTIIPEEISVAEVEYLGEAEVLMRKRYYRAAELTEYKAICILDADFFVLKDPFCYFKAAEIGNVVGVTLEQKRRYGDPNHRVDGEFLIDPELWCARDLCCAPMFVNPTIWSVPLKLSYDIVYRPEKGGVNFEGDKGKFKGPDMDAINICLLKHGSYKHTLCLDQHTWSGLHESLMKIFTRAVVKHDQLFTEDGREIFMIHGQWWERVWRGWQIDGQMGMIEREMDNSQRAKSIAQQSFDLVCTWYKDFATNGPISMNDYLPEGATDIMDYRQEK